MVKLVMKKSWVTTAVLAASIAGCSSPTAGAPTASDGASPGGSEETSEPSSPPETGPKEEPDFTNTALCELMTPDEATSLGGSSAGEPGNSVQDGHPQCLWSDQTSLVLGFQKSGQSGQIPSGPEVTNTEITVAGLPATMSKRVTSVNTNCQVIVNIGKTATIGTLAGLHDAGVGKYEECDLATKMANIILPKVLEK